MHNSMKKAARIMAVLGGFILAILIVITCVSVLGRSLNGVFHGWIGEMMPGLSKWALDMGVGPVTGDFELVEAGVAFAVFASLPLCQINSGHASVDILANSFSPKLYRFLTMVTEVLFALVLILIAWRLFDGMMSKRRYGETTFLLQFPIWWAYALSLVGAVMAAIAGVYMATVRIGEFLLHRDLIESKAESLE